MQKVLLRRWKVDWRSKTSLAHGPAIYHSSARPDGQSDPTVTCRRPGVLHSCVSKLS